MNTQTLEHFVGIGKHLSGIQSRLNVLAQSYSRSSPRSEIDDQLIAAFLAQASALQQAAADLAAIEFVPTDPATGFPIDPATGLPRDPATGIYHSPDTGEPLDPQPVVGA